MLKSSGFVGGVALATALLSANATAQIDFSDDFESGLSGWSAYVNRFENDCNTYVYGYPYTLPSPSTPPNVAVIADGSTSKVLNVYADYGNTDLALAPPACLVTSVYVERTLVAGDAADYEFSFDFEPPALEGVYTRAFIKRIDPNDSYSTVDQVYYTTNGVGGGSHTMEYTVDANMAGTIIQWGFENRVVGSQDSGMFYDNVTFAEAVAAPAPPTNPTNPTGNPTSAIPTTPAGFLVLMAVLSGWLGSRQLKKARRG